MTAAERWGPTPALCHSQDGMRSHCSGRGLDHQVGGGHGAGAGRRGPEAVHQVAVAAAGLDHRDFLLQDGGTSASIIRPVAGSRRAGFRRRASTTIRGSVAWNAGSSNADQSSSRPSIRGTDPTASAAPAPRPGHRWRAAAAGPAALRRSEAGPAGVVNAIHTPVRGGADGRIAVAALEGADGLQQVKGAARVPPQRGLRRGGQAGGDVCEAHTNMVPRPAGRGGIRGPYPQA